MSIIRTVLPSFLLENFQGSLLLIFFLKVIIIYLAEGYFRGNMNKNSFSISGAKPAFLWKKKFQLFAGLLGTDWWKVHTNFRLCTWNPYLVFCPIFGWFSQNRDYLLLMPFCYSLINLHTISHKFKKKKKICQTQIGWRSCFKWEHVGLIYLSIF